MRVSAFSPQFQGRHEVWLRQRSRDGRGIQSSNPKTTRGHLLPGMNELFSLDCLVGISANGANVSSVL